MNWKKLCIKIILIFNCLFIYSYNCFTQNIDSTLSVIVSDCGVCNSFIDAQVFGGVQPYFYSWVENSSSIEVSNTNFLDDPGNGNFILTVTDANGNSIQEIVNCPSYVFNEAIVLQTQIENATFCSLGSIDLVLNANVPVQNKIISIAGPNGYLQTLTIQHDSLTIQNLEAGFYIVLAEFNYCQDWFEVLNIEIEEEIFNIDIFETENTSCNNLNDGSLAINISQPCGYFDFEILLNNQLALAGTSPVGGTFNLNNLFPGEYIFNLVDSLNNVTSDTTFIFPCNQTCESILNLNGTLNEGYFFADDNIYCSAQVLGDVKLFAGAKTDNTEFI